MTVFTNVSDDVLEPGDPIRSVDIIALRDNPIAIAEGAAGAPKVVNSALKTGTNSFTSANLNAFGGVTLNLGPYAFFPTLSSSIDGFFVSCGFPLTPNLDVGTIRIQNRTRFSEVGNFNLSWRFIQE